MPTAALLTVSGGFLDAFTYVGHGHVFANSMTGNIVFLALSIAAGDWREALRHILPIVAFFVGVFVAHLIQLLFSDRSVSWARPLCLTIEIAFLTLVIFLPDGFPDAGIVLGIAFVAALQSTSFTRLNGKAYNSTMTTGNLRHLAETLYEGLIPQREPYALAQTRMFAAICGCFLVGAVMGGTATPWLHNTALIIPIAGLCGALSLNFRREKQLL